MRRCHPRRRSGSMPRRNWPDPGGATGTAGSPPRRPGKCRQGRPGKHGFRRLRTHQGRMCASNQLDLTHSPPQTYPITGIFPVFLDFSCKPFPDATLWLNTSWVFLPDEIKSVCFLDFGVGKSAVPCIFRRRTSFCRRIRRGGNQLLRECQIALLLCWSLFWL